MNKPLATALFLASLAALPLAAGCRGAHRVDPYEDTKSELKDGRVLPCALLEFSDQAGLMIAENLATANIISETPGRVTVVMGTIRNLTTSVSTSEFEIVQGGVRDALINSSKANRKLAFVMDRARMKETAAREEVVNANGTPANPPAYNAATTYVMNMDVNEVSRGDTHLYQMILNISHYGSNEIVLSHKYLVKHETR